MRALYPGGIGIWSVGRFCGGRKTRKPRDKPSEQDDNQQLTQPQYGAGSKSKPGHIPLRQQPITGLTAPSLLPSAFEPLACCGWFHLSLEHFSGSVDLGKNLVIFLINLPHFRLLWTWSPAKHKSDILFS